MSKIRFVGLDVHAETIAVAVADQKYARWGSFPIGRTRFDGWSKS
jgi:hypothetical protein